MGYVVYRIRGYYRAWGERAEPEAVWAGLVGNAIPASIAFLIMSKLMDNSGQIDVLALGLAEVAPPTVFAFFSGWIGLLGGFMTSSNAASNILFAPLQQTVAGAEGLSETTIISAQNAGGAVGNFMSPADVMLLTGTVGIVGW